MNRLQLILLLSGVAVLSLVIALSFGSIGASPVAVLSEPSMANAPIKNPIVRLPESPRKIRAGGQFDGGEFGGTMAANGVWARQLTQGTNTVVPIKEDMPSLDARAADARTADHGWPVP